MGIEAIHKNEGADTLDHFLTPGLVYTSNSASMRLIKFNEVAVPLIFITVKDNERVIPSKIVNAGPTGLMLENGEVSLAGVESFKDPIDNSTLTLVFTRTEYGTQISPILHDPNGYTDESVLK